VRSYTEETTISSLYLTNKLSGFPLAIELPSSNAASFANLRAYCFHFFLFASILLLYFTFQFGHLITIPIVKFVMAKFNN
jgi:hypothetical protein